MAARETATAENEMTGLEERNGVADGTRTRDNRNHNPGLYQLSYSHHLVKNTWRDQHWRARRDSNPQPPA